MTLIHPPYLHDHINIIMTSYHRPRDFTRSVDSILRHTDSPYKLFIIDNSVGGLNAELSNYTSNSSITIIRNHQNIGKAKSINTYYDLIMKRNNSNFFISMDSDVIVGKSWLTRFNNASILSNRIGILAPTIMNYEHQYFNTQIKTKFIMHGSKNFYHFKDELFYNRHLAGPLFFINRSFFERHYYNDDQLYGNDDGDLCRAAYTEGLFTGILSNVHVVHSRLDETSDYIKWKHKNIHNKTITKGLWDQ